MASTPVCTAISLFRRPGAGYLAALKTAHPLVHADIPDFLQDNEGAHAKTQKRKW